MTMTDIERITNDLSSLHWWVTVVVISFAVNILSGTLKNILDSIRLKVFGTLTKLSKAHRMRLRKEMIVYRTTPELLILKSTRANRETLISCVSFTVAIFCVFRMESQGTNVSELFVNFSKNDGTFSFFLFSMFYCFLYGAKAISASVDLGFLQDKLFEERLAAITNENPPNPESA